MSNEKRLLTTYDSELITQLSIAVCNEILPILDQHPELVVVKYQSINWKQAQYQSALIAGLNKKISKLANHQILMPKIKEYLQLFLVPIFFNSPVFHHLEVVIRESIARLNLVELNSPDICQPLAVSEKSKVCVDSGAIAILLLDAENLQLNSEMEKFLTTVSSYPLQVKIAFANWSKMGKQDVELHQRGYELIHVPVGKDNADGKMIALGSSVHERYANAKEVIVCSSDKVMTNLCNHLQQNGLIVYQAIKKGDFLVVLNSATGKQITQLPNSSAEIPTIEQFLQQIKELIKAEQEEHKIYWVKLSSLSKLFKSKYNLTISQVVSQHLPGKKARDIFINYPVDFAIHQVDATSELYVTLFEINQEDTSLSGGNKSELLSGINSSADLEKALQDIIKELVLKAPDSYIDISLLGGGFNQIYGKPITEQIKSLKLNGNFIKFLQSCKCFNLKQTDKGWQVALRQKQKTH
ncbi:NYN domain-containing protein [Nodularia harveyana UHCC-0300]|uniref:NYN domain-containing protein n=1 Tax=Nodularia harveyana UHCC-0300 TaxID=2974287 RepID=A0ABU5UD22_9CYAN|nr:NYN domain-containing protein [Nodularia harveyana]MEA5581434.1 NYN domain-containing protein [Nodularia harveyana UHCC-0300]